eukprot:4730203-Prymnesium_polylepis.1
MVSCWWALYSVVSCVRRCSNALPTKAYRVTSRTTAVRFMLGRRKSGPDALLPHNLTRKAPRFEYHAPAAQAALSGLRPPRHDQVRHVVCEHVAPPEGGLNLWQQLRGPRAPLMTTALGIVNRDRRAALGPTASPDLEERDATRLEDAPRKQCVPHAIVSLGHHVEHGDLNTRGCVLP